MAGSYGKFWAPEISAGLPKSREFLFALVPFLEKRPPQTVQIEREAQKPS